MLPEKHSLMTVVDELKRALTSDTAGRQSGWASRLDAAFATLEQAVSEHRANLSDEEGRVVDVDTPLNPSPTVARRAEALRQELAGLAQEARLLRRKLRDVHPSQGALDPATAAGALGVAPETADVTDFGVFCERCEQLLQRFEQYEAEEAELMQQSVTLDLGAGD